MAAENMVLTVVLAETIGDVLVAKVSKAVPKLKGKVAGTGLLVLFVTNVSEGLVAVMVGELKVFPIEKAAAAAEKALLFELDDRSVVAGVRLRDMIGDSGGFAVNAKRFVVGTEKLEAEDIVVVWNAKVEVEKSGWKPLDSAVVAGENWKAEGFVESGCFKAVWRCVVGTNAEPPELT